MKKHLGILALCAVSAAACNKKKSSTEATDTTAAGSNGGSGSVALSVGSLSLSTIPDLGGVVNNAGSSLALTMAGEAPKMSEITSSNFDAYMFGGAIAAVNAANTVSAEQRNALRRGESVCRNIGESANVFRELGGGTLCYMSKIPKLTASVTIDKEGDGITKDDYSQIFMAGEKARIIKINIKQEEKGDRGSFSALIKVYGKDTYAQGYAVDFSQCQEGKTSEAEQFRIDADAGTFTSVSMNEYEQGKYKRTVSASLKQDGDGLAWDLEKDRVISNEFKHMGDWGANTGKQKIVIDTENFLTQLIYATNTMKDMGFGAGSGESKIWAKTAFTGSEAKAIRLPEMALNMLNTNSFGGNSFTDEASGAVEWSGTTYADTKSSALYDEAQAFAFTSEALFDTAPDEPSLDFSSFDCGATPDVEVTFDMTTSEAGVVSGQCGDGGAGDALREVGQLCNSNDLQTARQKMWQHPQ